jgi:hypothetical protein
VSESVCDVTCWWGSLASCGVLLLLAAVVSRLACVFRLAGTQLVTNIISHHSCVIPWCQNMLSFDVCVPCGPCV